MVKKTIFYLFYIFCSFTLLVCGENNSLPYLTNSRFFWPLGAGDSRKKIPGAGATWEKKLGAGAT